MINYALTLPGALGVWVSSDVKLKFRFNGNFLYFRFNPLEKIGKLVFHLYYDEVDFVVWPNRVGEHFYMTDVLSSMAKWEVEELVLTYPINASSRLIILGSNSANNLVIVAPPDTSGKLTQFRLKPRRMEKLCLEVEVSETQWAIGVFKSEFIECQLLLDKIRHELSWPFLSPSIHHHPYALPIGLLDLAGDSDVPAEQGFEVLGSVAQMMENKIGQDNLLLVSGYIQNDICRDSRYSYSEALGGDKRLQTAITLVQRCHQKIVFSLDVSMAPKVFIDQAPKLKPAVLLDSTNHPILEEYVLEKKQSPIALYQMNSNSDTWKSFLTECMRHLKKMGADGVHLGRMVNRDISVVAGDNWGTGYLELIEIAIELDLEVYFTGASDIYAFDWGELEVGIPDVLPDGQIQFGYPLGTLKSELISLANPKGTLLVPRSMVSEISLDLCFAYTQAIEMPANSTFFHTNYLTELETVLDEILKINSK